MIYVFGKDCRVQTVSAVLATLSHDRIAKRTRVNKLVFPDPLGPIRRNEDSFVVVLERKSHRCCSRGIDTTMRKVMNMVDSVGLRPRVRIASKVP